MEVRREDHQHEALVQYLDRQGDWLEKTRGDLIVAASIIAAMSFQVMVNPPGGVWQEDQKCSSGEDCSKAKAGTAIFAHDDIKRVLYLGIVISSTISFSSSMSLILLVISGFRLRNRIIMVILAVFMVGAVICIAAAFCFALAMSPPRLLPLAPLAPSVVH
ncbi:hypothetical protein AALP_AA3G155400 [Arabis alpina]|uniref:PGG domain-containing protein n=1 Tax=Arabis alpina TaxID=50452 RepID=A0A087H9E3_ARAAL|nr:hypothetical protein AALP_AA3G155400 [Arabis alpina]